jgi:lipid A ethanolaminephosphotransferase
MGNHGPAYYKRYPKEFEKFTPVCKSNQLEECSQEEVSNAYDNAILYTDYFLSKVINFLKPYSNNYETAMVYMSDHGESLGENGIYLHGLPYFMAPDEQKHIGSLMWFGERSKEEIDTQKLSTYKNEYFSQDNLFHTLLGLFEVKTEVYKKDMDIINNAKKSQ